MENKYGIQNLQHNDGMQVFVASKQNQVPKPKSTKQLKEANELLHEAYKELKFHNWHNTTTGRKLRMYLTDNNII